MFQCSSDHFRSILNSKWPVWLSRHLFELNTELFHTQLISGMFKSGSGNSFWVQNYCFEFCTHRIVYKNQRHGVNHRNYFTVGNFTLSYWFGPPLHFSCMLLFYSWNVSSLEKAISTISNNYLKNESFKLGTCLEWMEEAFWNSDEFKHSISNIPNSKFALTSHRKMAIFVFYYYGSCPLVKYFQCTICTS